MRGSGDGFDWQQPALSAINDLSEADLAKTFQRVTINEAFVRMLGRGQDGAGRVQSMALALKELLAPKISDAAHSTSVLGLACAEVHDVALALEVLCGAVVQDGHLLLDKLSSNSTGKVVRHIISQTVYWKEAEKTSRQVCLASKVFMPEIEEVRQRLQAADVSLEKIPDIAQRMASWRDGLGEGSLY